MKLNRKSIELFCREEKITGLILEETESTNLVLKNKIKTHKPVPDFVATTFQTAGRGRHGKSFFSPKDCGLYVTFCFPRGNFPFPEAVTPLAALACRDAILETFSVSCGIKWVNDLYLKGKKVCGILCEAVEDQILIGIGVNILSSPQIPAEIQKIYGALDPLDCKDYSKLLKNMDLAIKKRSLQKKEILIQDYTRFCFHIGKRVSFFHQGKETTGICQGIDDSFHLIVLSQEKEFCLSSGEISI